MKYILESILDPIHKNLSNEIFNSNEELKPDVLDYILETFMNWWGALGYEVDSIDNIIIIGSMIGYQYADNSDIDVNIQVSISNNEIKEIIRLLPNGNLLPNTDHPINYYLTKDSKNVENADNAYDLLSNKWIKKPEKINVNIPYNYVLEVAKLFMDAIDLRVNEYKRDKQELKMYKDFLNDETLEVNKDEINDMLALKETELIADLDSLYVAYKMIKSFRHEAFDEEFEPYFLINIEIANPNFSVNNMVYKILENFGYLKKLEEYIAKRKEYNE